MKETANSQDLGNGRSPRLLVYLAASLHSTTSRLFSLCRDHYSTTTVRANIVHLQLKYSARPEEHWNFVKYCFISWLARTLFPTIFINRVLLRVFVYITYTEVGFLPSKHSSQQPPDTRPHNTDPQRERLIATTEEEERHSHLSEVSFSLFFI